ncbi:hypothetical protein AOLI_G00026840 [Acnodon oligacanthus]
MASGARLSVFAAEMYAAVSLLAVLSGEPLALGSAGGPASSVFLCSGTVRMTSSGSASLRCSMSSSADFSDDDDSSLKSGSVSPAPGDTLPWNLPRHERSKRKIQGGSVLDPAERAVLRIAGKLQLLVLLGVFSQPEPRWVPQARASATDLLRVSDKAAALCSAGYYRLHYRRSGARRRSHGARGAL